jgi:hypothetical protein
MPRSRTTHRHGLRRRPLNCGTVPRLVPTHWRHPSTFVPLKTLCRILSTWTSTPSLSGNKHPHTRVEPRHRHVMYCKFLLISLIYTASLPLSSLLPRIPSIRHTHTLSFVKTWRLINAIFTTFPTPLPHAFHFRFYFFLFNFFRLFSFLGGGFCYRREWFIAGLCMSARARDDGFTAPVGRGWYELVQRGRT